MSEKMSDLTLGIHPVAWAVAHLLHRFEVPAECYVTSAAWYNGRERGIVFSFQREIGVGKALCIAVFEHRNSDSICALRWIRKQFDINPPCMATDGDDAYPTKHKFDDIAFSVGHDEAGKMAEWVREQAEIHLGVRKAGE